MLLLLCGSVETDRELALERKELNRGKNARLRSKKKEEKASVWNGTLAYLVKVSLEKLLISLRKILRLVLEELQFGILCSRSREGKNTVEKPERQPLKKTMEICHLFSIPNE